ncbi:MAG: DUF3098 domain-containing protein [Chitinophagaceae bacterium]|nr:DUF3098 domain-containing protein [Chitinophagaceae bacterium]
MNKQEKKEFMSTKKTVKKILSPPVKSVKKEMPFQVKNYTVMLIGIALLIIGFYIMTLDKEPYGFGLLGITIGPIVVLIGFLIQYIAILINPKK